MQKNMLNNAGKICLTLLSLSLLSQTAFGLEDRVSYLDSVTNSYMYKNQESDKGILNSSSFEAQGVEATFKLDSNTMLKNGNAKINLSLRDSDIRQVLRMLADKAKMNISFDESVEGKITLDLNNIALNDAFAVIFKTAQLTYFVEGNTIMVMKLDSAKNVAYTRKNMTVLPVKYVNAKNVASFLNSNLFNSNIYGLSSKPIVTSNPRTNQIVMFGSEADVNAVKRILPVLDTKPMINTYRVAHTTPKEMANLICSTLLRSGDANSGDSSSSKGESEADSDSDDNIVLGGGTVACTDKGSESKDTKNVDGLASFVSAPLTVAYFSDLGNISIYGGSVEQAEIIKEFIKEHDKKQLMAYVELSVIELNESGSKEFSNTWDLWTPFISLGFDAESGLTTKSAVFLWGNQYPSVATNISTATDSLSGSSTTSTTTENVLVKRSNNHALTYQLKYLIENGNGRVLTNPKIMITNGRKATIDMTSDYVKKVTSQILQSSSTITSGIQRTYDIGNDDGFKIEILPFISPEGYVSMNIVPEFATIKEQVYAKGESGERELAVTLLQRRDLELKNIRVKDGETLVLAGLIQENETQSTGKMPFLADLPVVGSLFRSSSSRKTRGELVIVVTPHIVKDIESDKSPNVYNL